MLAAERRTLILEKLMEEKKVIVSELGEQFGVSEETIRRDLDKLNREGLAIKSYGGAVLNENSNIDMPFRVRQKKNLAGKQKIASFIADLISDGEHIILDPSTTAVSIVKSLRDKERLTIITNSIEVLVELSDTNGWEVISTGGVLNESNPALVGPRAIKELGCFHADKLIFSCKGIDMESGITDSNDMFSQVKQAMLSAAKQKILAVDCTKFDKVAFSGICGFDVIDMVVTDKKPSEKWLKYFEERGIACLYGEET